MYIKKLKLDAEHLLALMSEGSCKCPARSDAYVGSTYELSQLKGKYVLISRCDNGIMELRWNEEGALSVGRGKNGLRKANVKSRRDEGAFIGGKSKFLTGEEVAVAESYFDVCNRLGKEYMEDIAKAYGCSEVSEVRKLGGWRNKKYVMPDLMPRRIRIVNADVMRVSEISEELWHLMGVDWVNEEMEFDRKIEYVGKDAWNLDRNVVVYTYTTIKGSVQGEFDAMTYKEREEYAKKLWRERLK